MVVLNYSSKSTIALTIALLTIDSGSVLLRLLAKSKAKAKLGFDDWWIFIAWAFSVAYFGLVLKGNFFLLLHGRLS